MTNLMVATPAHDASPDLRFLSDFNIPRCFLTQHSLAKALITIARALILTRLRCNKLSGSR